VYILQIKKTLLDRKLTSFLMKKGTHLINPKKQKCLCHRTTFYSIFILSSYRKPDIQNDLLKLTKIKWIYQTVIKNVTMFISSCFNNYSTNFKKGEIKKVTPPVGFEPAIHGLW